MKMPRKVCWRFLKSGRPSGKFGMNKGSRQTPAPFDIIKKL
jgi:hypothetical protein